MIGGSVGAAPVLFFGSSRNLLRLFTFAAICSASAAPVSIFEESRGTSRGVLEKLCSNCGSGGPRFDPGRLYQPLQRLTSHPRGGFRILGAAQGQRAKGSCTAELQFESATEPLGSYSGAVWIGRTGLRAMGAGLSEDDGGRHSKGYRNRWRYTLTGVPGVGLPIGCALRYVTARALPGGAVAVSIDDVDLLFLPGDPNHQERINRVAPACERNRQLVNVAEVSGRWVITIEEPEWLPWSRERC